MKPRHAAFAAMLVLSPGVARAYVDPGIVATLYQLGYLALFGLATTLIFRPWGHVRSLIRRARGLQEPPLPETDEDAVDG